MENSYVPGNVISDMKEYYEARAAEYDEWFYRKGRYDHGEARNNQWDTEAGIVRQELLDFSINGDILELAPGTGIWTQVLINSARSLTAVDASPAMIEINRQKVADDRISYVLADLFEWQPDRMYDGIFFGFWMSHVPFDRLDDFLLKVGNALKPDGKVFFIDSRPDQTMSARNHKLPEPGNQIMKRILNNGSSYNILKNFFDPDALTDHFDQAGICIEIKETRCYFLYGAGRKK